MKLAMLNTTIATTNGVFKITDLSLEQARQHMIYLLMM